MRISSALDPFQKLDWIWTHVPLQVQCNSNERICCGGRHHLSSHMWRKSGGEKANKGLKNLEVLSRYFFLKRRSEGKDQCN